MTLDEVTAALRKRLIDLTGLGYCVRFDFGDDGAIVVDGRRTPPAIDADAEPDTTIRMSIDNGLKLLNGTLNPTLAYTMGKLRVEGSMGVALKVASMLEA